MKLSRGWLLLGSVAGAAGALYLANASWLADPSSGAPRVVAQRGVSQRYSRSADDDSACSARSILPPSQQLIDNTLPSIGAAIAAGADVVEVDIRGTRDRQLVLFHDERLECRTEGSGALLEHTVSEVKTLDVGYGYTADGGKTFPLRGVGQGLMPTLAEVLVKYPRQRFLVQVKDNAPGVADEIVDYLQSRQLADWDRLSFFGSALALDRLRQIVPHVRTWSARSVTRCLVGYLETGWSGHVPASCEGGMIIVPVEQAGLLWGWPNRFLARMRAHHTEVMLIARIDVRSRSFARLDDLEELSRVPAGFDGAIWTDQIAVIGPAVRWPMR